MRSLSIEYITDGEKAWRFLGDNLRCNRDYIVVGSSDWKELCSSITKLRYYSKETGTIILKLRGRYWQAYGWPMHKRPAVVLYIGSLWNYDSTKLHLKMAQLRRRVNEKRTYYLAEKARRRRYLKSARQKRYRMRQQRRVDTQESTLASSLKRQ